MEQLSGFQIVSLVGRQGSGKTTIGVKIARRLQTSAVEVSSIVRVANKELSDLELAKSGERTKQDPDWLGDLVNECLLEVEGDTKVLTGAREPQVHKYLASKGHKLWVVALTADPFTRYNRLVKQGRVSTATEFIEREIGEWKLGLGELMDSAPLIAPTSDTTRPQFIAEAIMEKLKGSGANI